MKPLSLVFASGATFDSGSVALIVGLLLLFGLLVGLSIHFGMGLHKDNEYLLTVQRETSSVRFLRYDKTRGMVTYFNLSNIDEVRSQPIGEFHASFPSAEKDRLVAWLDDLLAGHPSPEYLEVHVYIGKKRNRRVVPSFLKLSEVNLEKGVAHLESYLLSGLSPSTGSSIMPPSSEDDFAEALKSNGYSTGFTFCFSFYPSRGRGSRGGRLPKASKEQTSRFRGLVSAYVKGNQKLIQCSENEFLLPSFEMSERSEAIDFALRSGKAIDNLLIATRKKREALHECRIGIVTNKDLMGDADGIIAEARAAAASARDKATLFEFYEKGRTSLLAGEEAGLFKNEVDRIIEEKRISFSYRPVYSVTRRFIYAYLAQAKPVNTSFASIDELKNYARRAQDDKNLFAHIAKNLVSRFVSERELKSQKLVFPVRVDELPLIEAFFPRYRTSKDANLVFLFREEDIISNVAPGKMDDFVLSLSNLKEKGFQFAFSVSGSSLVLDQHLLSMADSFYVDFSNTGGAKMDTRVRSQLHALVEKLLKYKRPIIASNLLTWTALEICVGSGIDYVSCDVFAPYDQNLRPIHPKNIQRIQSLRERK